MALIITIIILIIIAAVTIKGILDHNLIGTTTNSIQEYDKQQKQETKMLNDIYDILDNTIKELGTGGNSEDPRKDLTDEEKEQTKDWDTDKVDIKKDEDGKVVPVPNGFTPSDVDGEKKIDTGYVIKQDGTENEFVWVPIVGGYEFGKLYDFGKPKVSNGYWKFERVNPAIAIEETSTQNHEPDILTETNEGDASDKGIELLKSEIGLTGTNEEILTNWKIQLENEYAIMLKSVTTYGGFYIGRYETGFEDREKATVKKDNLVKNITNRTWYYMYQKSKNLAKDLSIDSTMIWGCQYDATMQWFLTSEDAKIQEYVRNSSGKGYYKGSVQYNPVSTGKYKVNNIYDMAGNCSELTLESNGQMLRVQRGGDYSENGDVYPVSVRGNSKAYVSADYVSSRLTLVL